MLSIKRWNRAAESSMGFGSGWDEDWHLGEAIPSNLSRIVQFQADGHELQMILEAMRYAYVEGSGVVFDYVNAAPDRYTRYI